MRIKFQVEPTVPGWCGVYVCGTTTRPDVMQLNYTQLHLMNGLSKVE